MEINKSTKMYDLLQAYPELENYMIKLAPEYKNLKNPILRKTVLRIATLENVARIGGLDVDSLINTLTKVIDGDFSQNPEKRESENESAPEWLSKGIDQSFIANKIIEESKNPLAVITDAMNKIHDGGIIELITDFSPVPMMEKMSEKGYKVYTYKDENQIKTYFAKL